MYRAIINACFIAASILIGGIANTETEFWTAFGVAVAIYLVGHAGLEVLARHEERQVAKAMQRRIDRLLTTR